MLQTETATPERETNEEQCDIAPPPQNPPLETAPLLTPTPDPQQELLSYLVGLCVDYMNRTSKTEIPVPFIGEELKKAHPEWKKDYKVKTLKELIAHFKPQIRWVKHGTSDFVYLPTSTPKLAEGDLRLPLHDFLLGAIKAYFHANPEKKEVSSSHLGKFLIQKDPKWRKTYKTRLLSDALDLVKDEVMLSSEGTNLIITLK